MTPFEIIRQAQADTLIDEDGQVVTLKLLPGPSQTELEAFGREVACDIPPEIAELLSACRGFYGTIDQVDFTGRDILFEFEPAFPFGLPIAADGYGNFWVGDLHPHTARWGPIYFVCHDAPVAPYQADSLEQFLQELFRMFRPQHQSLVDDVRDDRLARVWQTNPAVLSHEQCPRSDDPIPSAFARELDDSFQVIDLRRATSWVGLPTLKWRQFSHPTGDGTDPKQRCGTTGSGSPERVRSFANIRGSLAVRHVLHI